MTKIIYKYLTMNISISEKVLQKYGLSLDEFLLLYLCSREPNTKELVASLLDKGIVDKDLKDDNAVVVSDNTKELIADILVASAKVVLSKSSDFNDLANKMREIFPAGRKPETTYYWRDSTQLIARKLETLVTKFNAEFTEEEALNATRRYVESFNGDYRYMQLLKYFILKTDRSTGEIKSEFLSLLQNPEEQDTLNDNWLNEIR